MRFSWNKWCMWCFMCSQDALKKREYCGFFLQTPNTKWSGNQPLQTGSGKWSFYILLFSAAQHCLLHQVTHPPHQIPPVWGLLCNSRGYCFSIKLRLGYLEAAILPSLEPTAKPKATSERLRFSVTYLKILDLQDLPIHLAGKRSLCTERNWTFWGKSCQRAARASCSLWNREPSAVMLTAWQGPILRGESRAGSEAAARFSQEPQGSGRPMMMMRQTPGQDGRQYLLESIRPGDSSQNKHSSVSTRQVHREWTHPESRREVLWQLWVQINRDHGHAKTQLNSWPEFLQHSSGIRRRPGWD